MTQQSLITRLKAVEEALTSASCPHCGGAGYTVREVAIVGCCGHCRPSGECCGEPIPVPAQEQVQCEWCYFKDIALSDLRELIKEAKGQDPVGIIDGNTSAYIWKKLPHETSLYTALGEKP